MTASASLGKRFDELNAILRALRKLEQQHRRNKRPSADLAELIAASRAGIYIMIYNSTEAAMRLVLRSIREKILAERLHFYQIHSFWCLDSLQAGFLARMQDGTNHGNVLAEVAKLHSQPISWEEDQLSRLVASGNFGKQTALRLKSGLNISWSAPPRTLGGDDLENVRKRRNALAHGLETFHEAGSKVTAQDLEDILKRVKIFMVSFVEALERYRDNRLYIIQ